MADRTDRERDRSRNAVPGSATKQIPKDAHAIIAMLKEMGVQEYDPRVVCQLLEFAYRYVTTILEDARAYAAHAKKKGVEVDDVRLAASSHLERSFTAPPPREVLLELTRSKNLTPLPLVKPHCGLRLPPDRYCLSACNYRLGRQPQKKVPSKVPAKPHQGGALLKKSGGLQTTVKTQPSGVPKPTFKFGGAGRIPQQRSFDGSTKMEVDGESMASKRDREDDDYDAL